MTGVCVLHIGVPIETLAGETRVAATPETVKKLVSQGHRVTVQHCAGTTASVTNKAYENAGAVMGRAGTPSVPSWY